MNIIHSRLIVPQFAIYIAEARMKETKRSLPALFKTRQCPSSGQL